MLEMNIWVTILNKHLKNETNSNRFSFLLIIKTFVVNECFINQPEKRYLLFVDFFLREFEKKFFIKLFPYFFPLPQIDNQLKVCVNKLQKLQ